MPANGNYAPPGYYLLWIVNDQGVPSTGTFVRFPAPTQDITPPGTISDLTASAPASNQVQLAWSAPTDNVGVTGYNIMRGSVKIGTATSPGYTDNTVSASTTYSYTVTAYDAAGNTAQPSNVATVTTPANVSPPVISNVSPSATTTAATITWTTDKLSDTQVAYGTSAAYTSSTPLDSTLVTSHSASITGLTSGTTYHYQVRSKDASGLLGTSGDLTFTTPGSPASLAIDRSVLTHATSASTTLRSPVFSTTSANELLVAFISSDGPSGASSQTVTTVTGAGLTWTLRVRSNAQAGDAEIWTAVAPNALTNVQVTATLSSAQVASINVVTFVGADLATQGATIAKSAGTGAPSAALTTTKAGSWVWGVGTDWSRAVARTIGPGQTLVDQYLAPVGDTYWVQRQTSTTAAAGTSVTLNDTAPTNDKWNFAVIEIRAAP
jgi:chitodextrinase